MINQLLICALAIIAAAVAYGLYKRRNMWAVIVCYWVVLTIKNIVEAIKNVF